MALRAPDVEVLALNAIGRTRADEIQRAPFVREPWIGFHAVSRKRCWLWRHPAFDTAAADKDAPALELRITANEIEIAVDGIEGGMRFELSLDTPRGNSGFDLRWCSRIQRRPRCEA